MPERNHSKSVSIGFEGLIELVDQHLMNALVESERPDSVLEKVLTEYAHDLRRSGQIPAQFEEEVLEELRDLTLDVIRKRTYGCPTIDAFRKSRKIL
jgi:hypothetical protein